MQEDLSHQVRLVDLSGELPTHPRKRYGRRSGPVRSVVVHHTGGSVQIVGRKAVESTAAFMVRDDDPERPGLQGRGWPGISYSYFIPFTPEVHDARLTVYRCQPDEIVTNHAGPWNDESVSITFQGTFDARRAPSLAQVTVWEALEPYLCGRYGIDAAELWPHAWRGKPACPGPQVVGWLRHARETLPGWIGRDERRQRVALALVLGWPELTPWEKDPTGLRLKAAIRAFQQSQTIEDRRGVEYPALVVDGLWGPATESLMRREMRARGLL